MLTATDLAKTYTRHRVSVPVLRGLSLTVQPGEFLSVVGASGSGKSTMLHLLGIDHERLTYKFQGLDARLTGVEESHVLTEILT